MVERYPDTIYSAGSAIDRGDIVGITNGARGQAVISTAKGGLLASAMGSLGNGFAESDIAAELVIHWRVGDHSDARCCRYRIDSHRRTKAGNGTIRWCRGSWLDCRRWLGGDWRRERLSRGFGLYGWLGWSWRWRLGLLRSGMNGYWCFWLWMVGACRAVREHQQYAQRRHTQDWHPNHWCEGTLCHQKKAVRPSLLCHSMFYTMTQRICK